MIFYVLKEKDIKEEFNRIEKSKELSETKNQLKKEMHFSEC